MPLCARVAVMEGCFAVILRDPTTEATEHRAKQQAAY
jgi:hypothetical protein